MTHIYHHLQPLWATRLMIKPERKFPPPWSVEEKSAHFAICDSNGRALAFVYFENESGRRSGHLLSKDEARRIATQMARVPELLQKEWINRSNQAE